MIKVQKIRSRISNSNHSLKFIFVIVYFFISIEILTTLYICNLDNSSLHQKFASPYACGHQSFISYHSYLGFYGTPNYINQDGSNIHNNLGFRGPDIKEKRTVRIAFIGGSTTYTSSVKNWENDIARAVEQNIYNIETINAGFPAWTTRESLINFKLRLIELEPDIIIIYHGINDLQRRLILPSNYAKDSIYIIFNEEKIIFPLKSLFVRVFLNADHLTRNFKQHPNLSYKGSLTKINDNELNTLKNVLLTNKPKYFEKELDELILLAKNNNITIILMSWTYGNNSKMSDQFIELLESESALPLQNEILKNLSQKHDIWFYDFEKEMSKNETYWADGVHLNKKGVELKANLISNFIIENNIIQP